MIRLWLVLVAAAWSGCLEGTGPLVPLVSRPDTRSFEGVQLDSVTFNTLLDLYRAHLSHEAATCLYGRVEVNVLVVTYVVLAQADSADDFHVYYGAGLSCQSAAGGERLVGISHDHPHTHELALCTHSDPDVQVLFRDARALFSLVVCGNGWVEVLWQDGRRHQKRWATPE